MMSQPAGARLALSALLVMSFAAACSTRRPSTDVVQSAQPACGAYAAEVTSSDTKPLDVYALRPGDPYNAGMLIATILPGHRERYTLPRGASYVRIQDQARGPDTHPSASALWKVVCTDGRPHD
jgi:hypothetical protein